ncbi:hypothetical protein [Spirosoma pollinicola]|uniref:Uncharacterized protein n=1 Tax=Spirosoma pollinicola TaxID=2057025 RepID=A0A2K8Z988_9BACT|nr:hypothetical protein [Spirosoma pollinicola]AUD06432.1 hypothetical protein CWM47_34095 [Spirosoma pollinicola]RZM25733.1 MAG: hypothetical protein EOO88_18210 [Pedobacter sp.]
MTVHFDAVNDLYPQAQILDLYEYYKGRTRTAVAPLQQPSDQPQQREKQIQQLVSSVIQQGATRIVLTVQDLNGTVYHPDFKTDELIWH